MKKINTKKIALAGVIGALYIILSLLTLPISSGIIQIRIAEGLTILPLFFGEAVIGVFVGCLLANIINGCAIFDIVFGSIITLISAILTYYIGKKTKDNKLQFILGGLFPVILNSFLLPLIWVYVYKEIEYIYIVQVVFLLISQSISVYGIGYIVKKSVNKIYKN